MAVNKTRYFNRLLIVIGISAGITFFAYVYFTKRLARHYFIPKGYSGWVTVKFEKKDAPPLPEKDGAYQLYIPESGVLETSTDLEYGWARDEHYWWDGQKAELIPKKEEDSEEYVRYVHDSKDDNMDFTVIIQELPNASDTTLWEGTRISKNGDVVDVQGGRKVMHHFFVSEKPEAFYYRHDSLPPVRKVW